MQLPALLTAVGAIQGGVLAAALMAKPRGPRRANRFMAALLGVVALALLGDFLRLDAQWRHWPASYVALSSLPFLFGPLLLAYVQVLTGSAAALKGRHLGHALPWVVNLVLLTPWLMLPEPQLIERIGAGLAAPAAGVNLLALGKAISLLAYTGCAMLQVRRWQRSLRDQFSNLDRVNLRWLSGLLVLFLVLECVFLSYLLGLWPPGNPVGAADTAISLLLTLLVLATGVLAVRQPQVFSAEPSLATERPAEAAGPPRGLRNLPADRVPALRERLQRLMSEQALYRDRELSLRGLAQALGASPHQVSELLNQELGCNFFDFINGERVAAVQRGLREQPEATVLDLALEAGFNNKSTFNKAFRRVAGCTPTEWKAAQGNRQVVDL
ncbi:AraC family transcriptional regulator [Inhella gelatinilytica]|uniref:AraC family transcriptional regulator n=1 Tax=Inhella gelatinilytica TaxID=2795030 RepID=A0A931IRW0_9BURK|nr:helix-turn-helix domain-containing protein [Inhella gelatinilytica]MBH9551542.1 AraC family transcriptional regulator [Inhella gelatinilytica]